MRTLARAMVTLALIAAPLRASTPTAGAPTVPAPAVHSPAVHLPPPSSPDSDPCAEAIAELEAASAFYVWTILLCPVALCIPLTYAAGDLVLHAAAHMLTACAI